MSIKNPNTIKVNNQLTSLSSSSIKLIPHGSSNKKLKKLPISKKKLELQQENQKQKIFLPRKIVLKRQQKDVKQQKLERGQKLQSPFYRYKTQSLKSNKKQSLKNIFNRLSLELSAQKEKDYQEIIQRENRPTHPVIFIKDFSQEINRNKIQQNIFNKYRIAHQGRVNYLLTPISKEDHNHKKNKQEKKDESQKERERQKQRFTKSFKKLFNLPVLRSKTDFKIIKKSKPKSFLLDLQQSLLVIDKKESIQRAKLGQKSKQKIEGIKKKKKKDKPFQQPLSPWVQSLQITNQNFFPS